MYDLLGGGNVVAQRHRLARELGRGVGALLVVITERCPCRRELT